MNDGSHGVRMRHSWLNIFPSIPAILSRDWCDSRLRSLRAGGVIAYPTDSSYAFGCQIGNADAVQRIRVLRAIDDSHHLTLVCRDLAEIGRYALLDNWQFRIVKEGSRKLHVPAAGDARSPEAAQASQAQHDRREVPEHAVVQALLDELGEPLLSSTLIPAGASEALNDPDEIRARYEHVLDLIIDSGACHLEPTTVIDLAVSPPVVVRRGRGDPARLGLQMAI